MNWLRHALHIVHAEGAVSGKFLAGLGVGTGLIGHEVGLAPGTGCSSLFGAGASTVNAPASLALRPALSITTTSHDPFGASAGAAKCATTCRAFDTTLGSVIWVSPEAICACVTWLRSLPVIVNFRSPPPSISPGSTPCKAGGGPNPA